MKRERLTTRHKRDAETRGPGKPSAEIKAKDLTETMAGIDSPGRLGVQDADQAQTQGRYNFDQAAEKSFYAPKTPKMPKKNGAPP